MPPIALGGRLAACLFASLLAACATPRGDIPPQPDVPPRWTDTLDTGTSLGTLEERWWETLRDPTLDGLVARAEEDNANLSIAVARVAQAEALARLQTAARQPRLAAGVSAERQRVPASVFRNEDGSRAHVPAYRRSMYDARVVLGYEPDLFGRLALAAAAANADLAASAADRLAVRLRIRHDVVAAYAELRLADALQALVAEEAGLRRQLLSHGESRLAAGLDPAQQVRRQREQLAETMRRQAQLAARRHAALTRLAVLAGMAPAELRLAEDPACFTRYPLDATLPADLPADAIGRRPDVATAWHGAIAAGLDAERIRRERYPDLTLTGTGGFLSESLASWLRAGAVQWLAGIALQGPLWDAGRSEARADAAAAGADAAIATYRQQVYVALGEAESALAVLQAARAQRREDDVTHTERTAAAADATRAYTAGRIGQPELLPTQLERIAATQQMLESRYALLVAWAGVLHSLGR